MHLIKDKNGFILKKKPYMLKIVLNTLIAKIGFHFSLNLPILTQKHRVYQHSYKMAGSASKNVVACELYPIHSSTKHCIMYGVPMHEYTKDGTKIDDIGALLCRLCVHEQDVQENKRENAAYESKFSVLKLQS